MWITNFNLFWLILGIVAAVKGLCLVFRILNRLTDRMLPSVTANPAPEPRP